MELPKNATTAATQFYKFCEQQGKPPQPGRVALTKLQKFTENGNLNTLDGCTFQHVARFLDEGTITPRLLIGCADFGLSWETLQAEKSAGVWARSLAARLLIQFSE